MANYKIFLSAGIPSEGREYYGTSKDAAIADAVMAFTRVCAENDIPFYFGGQPAITPLVWSVAKDYNAYFGELLTIYQSKQWEQITPKEVDFFKNIVWTEAGEDTASSLLKMRNQMFSENETPLAIFIGGMNGIKDEYKLIKEISPKTRIIAFKSVGGASADVYEQEGVVMPELEHGFAYYQIMKKVLKEYSLKK